MNHDDQLLKIVRGFKASKIKHHENSNVQKALSDVCSKVKINVTKEMEDFSNTDPLELIAFLSRVFDLFL